MLQNSDKNDIILHKIRQDKTAVHGAWRKMHKFYTYIRTNIIYSKLIYIYAAIL